MTRVYLIIAFLTIAGLNMAFGQNARLAQQYFQNGEYEKAAEMYADLYQNNGNNDFFFDRYFDCLLALEDYSEAEAVIKRQIRRDDGNVKLYVSYGTLLERLNRYEEAEEQFNIAIENVPADQYSVTRLANAFIRLTKYPFVIRTYENEVSPPVQDAQGGLWLISGGQLQKFDGHRFMTYPGRRNQ